MSNQFSINGHAFEDGFNWIALTSPTDAAISSALAEKSHGCYVSLGSRDNHDTISGLALGSKEVKHGSGKTYSLAAFIYDHYKLDLGIDHFVYVREMGDDGYYYLEVSGGYIQQGDIIIPSLEKLHDIFEEAAGGSLEIYVDSPNSKLIAGDYEFRDISTEELLAEDGVNNRHIIKTPNDARIKLIRTIVLISVIAAGIYGLYWGGGFLKSWWDARNEQQVSQKSPQQIALEKRAKAERVVGERLKAQTSGFSAHGLTQGCVSSYLFQGGAFNLAGWSLKSMSCDAGGLKTAYEQNNIYELAGDDLVKRFASQPDVKVSVSKNGQWLEKATINIKEGFAELEVSPGLFLEQLPAPGEANGLVKPYLRTLYKTGFIVDDIKEFRVSFPPEDEIPEELLYFEGQFSISAPSLSQLEKITSHLEYEWMRMSKIEFPKNNGNPQVAAGADMPYKAKFNYYFK